MKKEKSEVAKAASLIRKDLKDNFPGIKFKVRSKSFSMGDSIGVRYENGPTIDNVKKIIGKYQYGHFDGMNDIYEYSNTQDFPQTKYLNVDRDISEDIYKKAIEYAKEYISDIDSMPDFEVKRRIQRYLDKCDLTTNEFRKTMLHPDVYNTGIEPIDK